MDNKRLRICFDVDGVVANPYDENGNWVPYPKREPYEDAIKYIHLLKAEGHTIIFQTARGMQKYSGHQQKAHDDGYLILIWWLKEHGIPYDEVYFGKTSADIYIDDRAFRLESKQGSTQWENLIKEIDNANI